MSIELLQFVFNLFTFHLMTSTNVAVNKNVILVHSTCFFSLEFLTGGQLGPQFAVVFLHFHRKRQQTSTLFTK